MVPVLVGLSVFTVSLAVIAGVRRQGLPEGELFVVDGWGQWLRAGVNGAEIQGRQGKMKGGVIG